LEAPVSALYIAYFSGVAGNSVGLFFIGNGIISGIDVGGMKYDGNYKFNQESKRLEGEIRFVIPAGEALITGLTGGNKEIEIKSPLALPENFADGSVVPIKTPAGNVNARFEKLKEIKL
jgi:hypothetical protein